MVFAPFDSTQGNWASKERPPTSHIEAVEQESEQTDDEPQFLDGLLGTSARWPPQRRHAALLSDPRLAQPANAVQRMALIGRLQRNYGNAYVQRVVQQELAKTTVDLAPEVASEGTRQGAKTSTSLRDVLFLKGDSESTAGSVDVAIIVGRPSFTIEKRETPAEREQMEGWRAAAGALAPVVFEGLNVERAFSGLKGVRKPINKLYIIGHGGTEGFCELDSKGIATSTTLQDLTTRIKKTTGALGKRAPKMLEILYCGAGGSPRSMAKIAGALGAPKVRAPVQGTVISPRIIKVNGKRLTARRMRRISDEKLASYIKQTDALKHYDFVPGVPHPSQPPSRDEKLKALARITRQRGGVIPMISFNEAPGAPGAVPYWKASVEKRKQTEELSEMESMVSRGVIEVEVEEPAKTP